MGRLEGAEGGALIVGEQAVTGAHGEVVVGQEAIQGAIRDARDLGAESGGGGDQLAQLRDASGGQFVDRFQQLLTQRRIVDPCRGGPRAVEQQAAWPPSPIAEQVAADAALPDPVLLLVAALLGAFVDLRQQRIEQHLDQVHEDAALSGHLQGTDGRCTAVETHREHAMER